MSETYDLFSPDLFITARIPLPDTHAHTVPERGCCMCWCVDFVGIVTLGIQRPNTYNRGTTGEVLTTPALVDEECVFCATRDGAAARDAAVKTTAKRDLEWWTRAEAWLDSHYVGTLITADDLVDAIGLPDGSPNAVGAFLRTQAMLGALEADGFTTATRPSSHGRTLRLWRVTA